MKVKWKGRKVSENFAKDFLDDIKLKRIMAGIDKNKLSDARITEALLKEPELSKIKDKIIRSPRAEDLI